MAVSTSEMLSWLTLQIQQPLLRIPVFPTGAYVVLHTLLPMRQQQHLSLCRTEKQRHGPFHMYDNSLGGAVTLTAWCQQRWPVSGYGEQGFWHLKGSSLLCGHTALVNFTNKNAHQDNA